MKILFAIFWLILILFGINLLIDIFDKYVVENLTYFYPLFWGFVIYFISLIFIKHKKYQFINTFFHEMAHLIFAIITFGKPQKLVVTNATSGIGGYVSYATSPFLKSIHNHIVALAPYFFIPLPLIFSLIIYLNQPYSWFSWLYSHNNINIYLFLTGFTYAYHLSMIAIQANPNQTDFNGVGYKYGLIFSAMVHIFLLLIVLVFITNKFGSIPYLKSYHYVENFTLSAETVFDAIKNIFSKMNIIIGSIK